MSDAAGFDAFVSSSETSLLRTAWLLTGNWATAHDLVQTALMKAWRHWRRVERAGDQEAYVRRIVVTTYLTWWRRRWRAEQPTGRVPEQVAADAAADVDTAVVVAAALAALTRLRRDPALVALWSGEEDVHVRR